MPCSRQWPAKPPNASALPELEVCEGKRTKPLDKEVSNNWVVATDLTIAEAQQKWSLGVAVGKLNVVFAENKEPRLVLDSTVCQVNTRCCLPERLSLPMASDLALATQAGDTPGAFLGASIDFKAAHKQIQVRPDERGLLLFAFQGRLYHYRVCHFGLLMASVLPAAPGPRPALLTWQAFLFVDDLLCALLRAQAPEIYSCVL